MITEYPRRRLADQKHQRYLIPAVITRLRNMEIALGVLGDSDGAILHDVVGVMLTRSLLTRNQRIREAIADLLQVEIDIRLLAEDPEGWRDVVADGVAASAESLAYLLDD